MFNKFFGAGRRGCVGGKRRRRAEEKRRECHCEILPGKHGTATTSYLVKAGYETGRLRSSPLQVPPEDSCDDGLCEIASTAS